MTGGQGGSTFRNWLSKNDSTVDTWAIFWDESAEEHHHHRHRPAREDPLQLMTTRLQITVIIICHDDIHTQTHTHTRKNKYTSIRITLFNGLPPHFSLLFYIPSGSRGPHHQSRVFPKSVEAFGGVADRTIDELEKMDCLSLLIF